MKKAIIKIHNIRAGILTEYNRKHYTFQYDAGYDGPPVSLILPVRAVAYTFESFPPFLEGLLPEGIQLESLLKIGKIDKFDYFEQLLATGGDLVGAITVEIDGAHE